MDNGSKQAIQKKYIEKTNKKMLNLTNYREILL